MEREHERNQSLANIRKQDQHERMEDRRTWHWAKMVFRHGAVLSRQEDEINRYHESVLHAEQLLLEDKFCKSPPLSLAAKLRDAELIMDTERYRRIEAMVKRGEEIRKLQLARENGAHSVITQYPELVLHPQIDAADEAMKNAIVTSKKTHKLTNRIKRKSKLRKRAFVEINVKMSGS